MNYYRLPSQAFKCGNSPTGEPCPVGPIGGRCSNRLSDATNKGCRPLRTLAWWSRFIRLSATLVALIGVSLAWSNFGGKESFAPGPLSKSHAQPLIAGQSESRCAACHQGNDASTATQQSDLCLKCHIQEMPDAVHGSPHDLHGRSLDELVSNGDRPNTKTTLAKFVSRSPIAWKDSATHCSQCHREHQGSSHDLNAMTTERCQACHRDPFHSFATDHPEFKDYPFRGQNKNIEFDHVKHRDLHFSKKSAKFDCKVCHVQTEQVGLVGQVFRSVSFEQACASCHKEPIKSAIQDGLIVLQIPSINRKELLNTGADIGNWPTHASQLTDGVIPPIMRWLIESEPGGTALLNELPATGRLVELDIKQERARDTLVKLSAMTRQLMKKLSNEGQPGFRSSVERLVSTTEPWPPNGHGPRESPWLDRFSSGIPPDLFRAAWNEWFEDGKETPIANQTSPQGPSAVRLSSSLQRANGDLLGGNLLGGNDNSLLNAGPAPLNVKSDSEPFKDSRAWDQVAFGGWMIDRQRMAIVYVPIGHADEWLSRWIELEEIRTSSNPDSTGKTQPNQIEMAKQCRQCHSLQPAHKRDGLLHNDQWNIAFRQANQNPLIRELIESAETSNTCWKSKRRAATLRPITKFDHTPHLALPKISDCRTCHQLESIQTTVPSDALVAYSKVVHEEFAPMKKAQCVGCHQPNAAGESCTQCHNYHVGLKGWQ